MGRFSFIKEADEKLFGIGKAQAAEPAAPAASPDQLVALNQTASQAIANYIQSMNLNVDAFDVAFDGASATVTVSGVAPDQTTKEKVMLCCGNVAHASHPDKIYPDQMLRIPAV